VAAFFADFPKNILACDRRCSSAVRYKESIPAINYSQLRKLEGTRPTGTEVAPMTYCICCNLQRRRTIRGMDEKYRVYCSICGVTIRDAILTCAQKRRRVSLIYRKLLYKLQVKEVPACIANAVLISPVKLQRCTQFLVPRVRRLWCLQFLFTRTSQLAYTGKLGSGVCRDDMLCIILCSTSLLCDNAAYLCSSEVTFTPMPCAQRYVAALHCV